MNLFSPIVCNLRRLLPVLILLALYAAPQSLAGKAAAQGTFGTLPDPISTAELMNYGHRLGLSPQQRQAVLTFHDEYKRQFRVLREGEIADFLGELQGLEGAVMPQRKVVEDLLKGMNRLNGRIAGVDRRLMDQIQTILTEDQAALMPRVRMARERKRLSSQWTMMLAGGPAVDLSEMFIDLELTPEELSTADPAMSQYEVRLTSSLRDLQETSLNMIMELFDALQQMGFDEQTIENAEEDPEAAMEMMEAMQAVFMQIMQKAMKASAEIKELNRQTYRTVTSLLPPEPARVFRNRFLTEAYGQARFAIRDFSPWRDLAEKNEELNDEQRGRVGDIADQLQARFDEIADRAVRAIDEFQAAGSFFNFNQDAWQKFNEAQEQLQADCTDALEGALDQVAEIAPAEFVDELRRQAGRSWTEVEVHEEEAAVIAAEPMEEPPWSGDIFLPGPINRADLGEYGRRLDLSDAERAVVNQLHEDYLAAYAQLREGEIQAVTDANSALWQRNTPSGNRIPPKPEALEEVYRLRRVARQAIEQLDGKFFEDLAVVLSGKEEAKRVPRLRLARIRSMCAAAGAVNSGFGMPGGGAAGVDLSALVRAQDWAPADLKKADAVLAEYEESLTESVRTRLELAMKLQQATEGWSAEAMRLQSEGDVNAIDWGMRYQQFVGSARKNLNEAEEAIGELNRETLDRLVTVLDTGKAGLLRRAYAKKAFPSVYNDPASVEDHLTRALSLGDLTSEQRNRLNEIAADYRPAYEQLSQKLIELGGLEPRWGMADEDFDWKAEQQRQQDLATVRFDRDELSARASAQLAAILTEEQVRRIGGLPEPPEDTNPWGY